MNLISTIHHNLFAQEALKGLRPTELASRGDRVLERAKAKMAKEKGKVTKAKEIVRDQQVAREELEVLTLTGRDSLHQTR